MKHLALVLISLASLTTSEVALAQPGSYGPGTYEPAPAPRIVRRAHKRSGLILGFSAGPALGDEYERHTGALMSAYIGGFINPTLALLFDIKGFEADQDYEAFCELSCGSDPEALNLTVWGGAAQLWLSDRLWVKGTLGIGHAEIDGLGSLSGLGWGGAAGFDLISGDNFALDFRVDVVGAMFEEGSSARSGLALGLTWR